MQTYKCALVRTLVAGLALAGVTACARVSTDNVMMRGPGLPKPELIIVHDSRGVTRRCPAR